MKLSFIRAMAASALLIASATAANAQTAAQPSSSANAATTPWAAVPVGVYKLDVQMPDRLLPVAIAIKDSSGAPTGTLTPEGDDAVPVKITVKGADLVINGSAEKGPFEIVMQRQGDQIAGRWTYGGDTGKLTGKVEK